MSGFRKVGILVVMLIATLTLFTACGQKEDPAAATYVDGEYYAEMPDFDDKGWKDNITVTITDGKISSVVLNSKNKDTAVGDKLTAVKNGQYDMKAAGAKADWDEQAKAIGDYLVANQGTGNVTFDEEGKSDAISGATIHYNQFFDLFNQALEQAKAK